MGNEFATEAVLDSEPATSAPPTATQDAVPVAASTVAHDGDPDAASTRPPMDKIIIAIHGIGSQRRSDTIRSVARRFADRADPPLPLMPLGFFNLGRAGEVQVSQLEAPDGSPLQRIGFAEVFWADIPRQVVKDDDTLEDTKAWGASVVSRAEAAYIRKVTDRPQLVRADFELCASVIDEIVETVSVMEKLLAVTEKLGIFKFDLAPLLRDYIGDVQLVTEFGYYRQKIVARFHSAMAQILNRFFDKYPDGSPEIYLVAHSEGTVVSFLGLLQALSGQTVCDPDKPEALIASGWIRYVRGFMTFGSPIDKHLVLWERIWDGLDLRSERETDGAVVFRRGGEERLRLAQAIQWRNYYDFGDPIGFRLETTVEFLAARGCRAFDFDADKHNFGFSRYWLPGKAHTDYWSDAQVFGHFIDDVVMRSAKPPAPGSAQTPAQVPAPPSASMQPIAPRSIPMLGIVSSAIPYMLAILLHFAAVFVLFKAVETFLTPSAESRSGRTDTAVQVGLLAILMYGVTVAARLPRLVKTTRWRWHAVALIAFLAGAVPTWLWLPRDLAEFLGKPFMPLAQAIFGTPEERAGVFALLLAAALISAASWFMPHKPRVARRTLLASGTLVVLAMIVGRVAQADSDASVWPVALAGLAFLYFWWLGILLFDLAFVWHRYIRNSVAVRTLSEWHRGRDARPEMSLRKKPADRA